MMAHTLPVLALLVASTIAAGAQNAPERGSDEHVREVLQRALDTAFESQIETLFTGWMKDANGQPQRAANGVRKAVRAYRQAIEAFNTEKLTWREPAPKQRRTMR